MNLLNKRTTKEEIRKIEEVILASQPILKETAKFNYQKIIGELYQLKITVGNRGCLLKTSGVFEFLVDGTTLFSYCQDSKIAAQLIKYWLVDKLMPSRLVEQYPNLNLSELSRYYEQGDLVKGEFLSSWANKEFFYLNGMINFNESKKKEIKTFLQSMINRKYNEKTRAGISMRSLVLTRERRHGGMRSNSPFVSFYFFEDKEGMLVTERDENLKEFEMSVIFDSRVEQILDKLIMNEIK